MVMMGRAAGAGGAESPGALSAGMMFTGDVLVLHGAISH